MNRTEYQGMCELFRDGQIIWVENELTRQTGRVVGCDRQMIEVEMGNHCEIWSSGDCSEMTHGFRVKYDEVKKYPHEYDSHLD